jgi:signal transduction histidine kinase
MWSATVSSGRGSTARRNSPGGGRVAVRVERRNRSTGEFAVLSVQDDGIDIPPDDLPHIFDCLRRVQNAVGRIPGTGIGRAGARWIAQKPAG